MPELTLYSPPSACSPRLQRVLDAGLAGLPCRTIASPAELRPGMRLLPAFSLPPDGLCLELFPLLSALRQDPALLEGCVGGLVIDGPGELYTKSVGRELALAMNLSGCALLGRPLVEAIGDLRNFTVQAANAACSLEEAYALAIRDTARRLLSYTPPPGGAAEAHRPPRLHPGHLQHPGPLGGDGAPPPEPLRCPAHRPPERHSRGLRRLPLHHLPPLR